MAWPHRGRHPEVAEVAGPVVAEVAGPEVAASPIKVAGPVVADTAAPEPPKPDAGHANPQTAVPGNRESTLGVNAAETRALGSIGKGIVVAVLNTSIDAADPYGPARR